MGFKAEASHEAYLDMFERQADMLDRMVREFRSGSHGRMPWKTVRKDRLLRIWQDAAREGFVRDEKGLRQMADVFIENVLRLSNNNDVSGHSQCQPAEAVDGRLEPSEIEAFVDWAIETDTGWRISDYGIEALFGLAALLSETEAAEDMLVVMDRMLNVVHPRSDLAGWFVEGGSRTLSTLALGTRPTDPEAAETRAAAP